ncbi:MAG: NAD-dependent epimerase/dehydratase family protein, partial [Ktedonobacterales bacterium]
MTARYLVTGGAGFIGSHIAEALVARGASVRVLDNLTTSNNANLAALTAAQQSSAGHYELLSGDIRDADTVRRAAEGVEVIFHHAAIASVAVSVADPVGTLAVNINGTQNVLTAAHAAGVRRVVFASSSAIYGDAPEQPKREDMPPAPISPYAVHKLTGEHLCAVATSLYGVETVALRYFNVFGPRQNPDSEYSAVIPRFLTALLALRQPSVYGDGEQTRDFVYIENVVRANLLAATAPDAVGKAINIGGGERISLNAILRAASELLCVPCQPDYQPARPGDVRDSMADISRAR